MIFMPTREQVCSQYSSCLSCPLSIGIHGMDCRILSQSDINNIMYFVRALEADTAEHNIAELFSQIRAENKQLKGEHPI